MPTRTASAVAVAAQLPATASTTASPARTARSASSSCACGPAEVGEHAVAHELGDVPSKRATTPAQRVLVGADDLAHLLGVEPRRERGRADQVAEHHRQLAALGLCACGRRCTASLGTECSDGLQELLAWAERQSKLFEISLAELGEHFPVNLVVAERRLIAGQVRGPAARP